ncbi:NYN domain-containing protein [Vagococcus salmoninarum]|uniref:YacP-like NYN domain-containing protein n=1 Tax=Vagococcus salmoninarum TaxID=2739 RepID=UPI0018805A23|nr:NYN domain-containing protein [Vagococcus salmoninarum]MBE9387681.1 NYN domain-containing protein [Vagococcus salmoninarum]
MKRQILLVDGYNMIGAWPELAKLKNQEKLEASRDLLLFKLSNYAKYEGIEVTVVFDAQFVPGVQQEYKKFDLKVVFTKKEETADSYIERETSAKMSRLTQVTVATSDLAEQWLVFSKGALRKSANELWKDIQLTKMKIKQDTLDFKYQNYRRSGTWNLNQLTELETLLNDLSDQ